jgi:hypothetical protein
MNIDFDEFFSIGVMDIEEFEQLSTLLLFFLYGLMLLL